jgi:hypothetical protein
MSAARRRTWRTSDAALASAFCVGLALPAALWLAGRGSDVTAEHRTPAPPPAWPISGRFPSQFEAYFADRFGLRNDLVHAYSWFSVHALAESPTPDAALGRDGWLYYAGDHSLDDFQGRRPFSDDDLERWRLALQRRSERLERQGIAYLFVVVPDKHTVYPEHLPVELAHPGRTRLDQLTEHLRTHPGVPLLDLRPVLRRARERELVYRPCDSHWNDRGAHAAYETILGGLADRFPRLKPWPRERFAETEAEADDADLARMLGLASPPREHWLGLSPRTPRRATSADPGVRLTGRRRPQEAPAAWTVAEADLPTAVVLHDSFGVALEPFLAEHFRRSLFLWQRTLEPDVLQRERPDLVIQELGERLLQGPPAFGPPDEDGRP